MYVGRLGDSPSVGSTGWPRCRVTGRHTWRKGRGAAAPCTSGAGTGSTRRRWRGSTAGSGCSATTDAVPAGTTPRSPTGRSGASASPSTGNPVCMRHRCSSTRWARPCGCRTCPACAPPVGLAGVVRPRRRTRSTHRVGRANPARRRRRGSVHRGSLATRHDAGDRRHAHRTRRVDAADLHGGFERRRRQHLRPTRRRDRPHLPPPVWLEGRPRPSTHTDRSRCFEQRSAHSPSRTTWCAAAPSSSTLHCASCVTNSIGTDGESAANPSSSLACVS